MRRDIHATTHENRRTSWMDHPLGVANMRAACRGRRTLALTNATFPYALQLANKGWKRALTENPALLKGLNIVSGKVTYPGVAEAFNMQLTDPGTFLS